MLAKPARCVQAAMLLIAACCCGGAAAQGDEGWKAYAIPEAGTRVEYPAGIFSRDYGASPRGTGHAFRTPDGRTQLLIYALPNDDALTPAGFLRAFLKVSPGALHYRRVTPRFFAVSGFHGRDIYYSRCNFAPPRRTMHCIELIYPEQNARAWDGIVTRISLSLRPLKARTSARD